MESLLNAHGVDTSLSVNEGHALHVADPAEDAAQKSVFVWYASYGSNILEERFNCYLHGGRIEGMRRDFIGARDGAPATASILMQFPYRVFFAYASDSPTWGYGGWTMLDVAPNQPNTAYMRLYKVTLQQFNDVVAQENGFLPPLPAAHSLTCEQLTHLRQQTPGDLRLKFESADYPAVAYLGEHEDVPILTFTCLKEKVRAFLGGEQPAAPPANSYLEVLHRGLQAVGLSEAEAMKYWQEIIDQQFVKDESNSLIIDGNKS